MVGLRAGLVTLVGFIKFSRGSKNPEFQVQILAVCACWASVHMSLSSRALFSVACGVH